MDLPIISPRDRLCKLTRAAEAEVVMELLPLAQTPVELQPQERQLAERLVAVLRAAPRGLIAPLLAEFSLDSPGGQALMSLAEAYLRVPDRATGDALIAAKLAGVDWRRHLAAATPKNWVRLAARALLTAQKATAAEAGRTLKTIATPMVREGVAQAMRQMGRFFVLGRDIAEALHRAESLAPATCSFDMLGEGARTGEAADAYFQRYRDAIDAVGAAAAPDLPLMARHSVSVKLSAIHPRYEAAQADRCVPELIERVQALAERAAARGIGLTIDAEETERLVMSLDIIAAVAKSPRLRGWDGLGMAVQAYQKRAIAVVDWAAETSRQAGRRLAVRLVKGAYWDAEIKRCQLDGLSDYPVFTRKSATEVSYLACARRMLEADSLQPAFATHNALTVATLLAWIGPRRDVEFQRLHGMGAELYHDLLAQGALRLRVYAPVGGHQDLLPYLVRRLLENGANSSFVHQAAAQDRDAAEMLADPRPLAASHQGAPHPQIALPAAMFGAERRNSAGLDLADQQQLAEIFAGFKAAWAEPMVAAPLINGVPRQGASAPVIDPADGNREVGRVIEATSADAAGAIGAAAAFYEEWSLLPTEERASCLDRAADLMERDRLKLMALLVREAGKTWGDALSEVREAVDFCRYYAAMARKSLQVEVLPGPTGERNELRLVGRGVFACISPWNFPLAIFTGQIAAALVTGNCVVAKPAPQTPLIAAAAVGLLLEAGVPAGALQLLPGGVDAGRTLVADPRVTGIVFTGSTQTAKHIARVVAEDETRPLVPLIAETGGLNAMIVDSTALPEQVVRDVIISAFQSAGQRCSALRLLCLQDEIAADVISMLRGAIAELRVGEPEQITTDVGPVIDATARDRLVSYVAGRAARVIASYQKPLPEHGFYVAPCVIELDQPQDLEREVFGPVLHLVRWKAGMLDQLIDQINRRGFGLTMGVHSRNPEVIEQVRKRARVGNLYVNRSMIGAVVGVQPFGGEGLSGTGPKAGGPHYLARFCVERTVSTDLTAIGGNTSLLGLDDDRE